MSQTTHLDRILDELGELRRLVLMAQPRMGRVKEYKEGKIRVFYEGGGQQGGQGGQGTGSGSGGSGSAGSGGSASAGSSGGSGGQSEENKEWISPWLWPGENHVGHVREDTPYKEGQLVWVWTPNGDPNQAMIMPGPPSKDNKLPDHRDDKKRTRQAGRYKEELSTDGKKFKSWQLKNDPQQQQGGQQQGGQTGQQQKEDKPEDILNLFQKDSEGGVTLTSQKAFTVLVNSDPKDEKKQMKLRIEPDNVTMQGKDGSMWKLTKEKIEQRADTDGQKYTWDKDQTKIEKGKIKHDNQNIGKGHRHTEVMPGGGLTGEPEADA